MRRQCVYFGLIVSWCKMSDDREKDPNAQEFKLDPDTELRFEVETKNEKVLLEVSN